MELIEKQALSVAVKSICFDDDSDYEEALWEIVRLIGGDDAVRLLEEDKEKAYKEYCF